MHGDGDRKHHQNSEFTKTALLILVETGMWHKIKACGDNTIRAVLGTVHIGAPQR